MHKGSLLFECLIEQQKVELVDLLSFEQLCCLQQELHEYGHDLLLLNAIQKIHNLTLSRLNELLQYAHS
ncbi:hypothetical protein D9M71_515150 [compost metagenome]